MSVYVPQGDVRTLRVSIYNGVNQLIDPDPGTPVLTLQDINGAVQAGFPTTSWVRLATGLYAYNYTASQPVGHYRAIWAGLLGGVPMEPAIEDVWVTAAAIASASVLAAGVTDLWVVRGDTPAFAFAILVDGAPLDLTGAQVIFTAKRSLKDLDEDALISKEIGAGLTLVDAVAGLLDLSFGASDTASLRAPSVLRWDVSIIESGGLRSTPLIGKLHIVEDVTRA